MKKIIYSTTLLILIISAILFYSFCMRDGKIDSIHIARITKNIDHISGMRLMNLYLEKKILPEEYQALWEVINEKRLREAKDIVNSIESPTSIRNTMASIPKNNDESILKIFKEQIERLENAQSLVYAHDEIIDKAAKGLSAKDKQYIRENSIGGYTSFDWNEYYMHKRQYE